MNQTALQVMDITTLKAVIADLRQIILPSRFEKAQQPEPGIIQIALRNLKGLIWLEISWQAEAPRLVQISPPSRIGCESTLAQQIQHGLSQMALVQIRQNGFDRVVEFDLAKRPGGPIHRVLVVEIMGKHSNLLLLDNQKKIITLGRQVRSHQSRVRPLGTGDTYILPPVLQGIAPSSKEPFQRWKERLSLVPVSLKKALQESYQGISPSLALQLASDETDSAERLLKLPVLKLSDNQWLHLYQRWSHWLLQLENESLYLYFNGATPFRLWSSERNESIPSDKISLTLGEYYRKTLNSKKLNQLIKEQQQRLIKLQKLEEQNLHKQESLLTETSNQKTLQNKADQLLCMRSLNSDLINEAQKLYNKAKKLRRSLPALNERISYHKQRLQNMQESSVFLDDILTSQWEKDTEKIERLIELRQELDEYQASSSIHNQNRSHAFKQKKQLPNPLSLKSPNGLEIQIGRNHRQNEWISLNKSRSGDIWFHVQECPGSHVVLKASNGIAEEADLQMAADLAAFFSRAKGNQRVPVIRVSTDHLQRIPGAKPGTVRHRLSKVCWGEPFRGMQLIKA